MTPRTFLCAGGLLAIAGLLTPLFAEDLVGERVGPFRWARKLLDADPALVTPTDLAADGTLESAQIIPGSGPSTIKLTQWVGVTQAGSKNWSNNTLVGDPGKNYAIGLKGWWNTDKLNTGAGWVQLSKMQQDATLRFGYIGSNQTATPVIHGATNSLDGVLPAPSLVVSLVFRRLQGSGLSVWQTGYYKGNPLQVGVWQVPAGQSLAQAQVNQANCLSTIDVLKEISPDVPFLADLKVRSGGQWQLSLDLDADGQEDVDLTSGQGTVKPYTVGDIDQSGGLWVIATPVSSVSTGAVGITTMDLIFAESTGTWMTTDRDRRPLRLARNFSSRVSPAQIQGSAWTTAKTVTVAPNVGFDRFADGTFRTKIPLDAATASGTAVVTQSGSPDSSATIRVDWIPTNVVSGGTQVIRRGETLLLTAEEGYASGKDYIVDLFGNGSDIRIVPLGTRFPVTYNTVGTFIAKVYEDRNQNGLADENESVGNFTVVVTEFSLPAYIPCGVNYAREFILDTGSLSATQVRLISPVNNAISVGSLEAINRSIKTTLKPLANNEPIVESRHVNGTLLDARAISTFILTEPTGSIAPITRFYSNGAVLLGGQLQMEPVRPNLDVVLQIFVSGAAFADGGLQITLPSNDFIKDPITNIGTKDFDLYRSSSSGSGGCHSAVVRHGSTRVGP